MDRCIKRFEDLEVWKNGLQLSKEIYQITKNDTFKKDFGLRDQIRRAAVSIPSNIAEGFERISSRELMRFLKISKGSCGEVRTQLYIAHAEKYISDEEFKLLLNQTEKLTMLITSFIAYLYKLPRNNKNS
jgi:four helix bundle protein